MSREASAASAAAPADTEKTVLTLTGGDGGRLPLYPILWNITEKLVVQQSPTMEAKQFDTIVGILEDMAKVIELGKLNMQIAEIANAALLGAVTFDTESENDPNTAYFLSLTLEHLKYSTFPFNFLKPEPTSDKNPGNQADYYTSMRDLLILNIYKLQLALLSQQKKTLESFPAPVENVCTSISHTIDEIYYELMQYIQYPLEEPGGDAILEAIKIKAGKFEGSRPVHTANPPPPLKITDPDCFVIPPLPHDAGAAAASADTAGEERRERRRLRRQQQQQQRTSKSVAAAAAASVDAASAESRAERLERRKQQRQEALLQQQQRSQLRRQQPRQQQPLQQQQQQPQQVPPSRREIKCNLTTQKKEELFRYVTREAGNYPQNLTGNHGAHLAGFFEKNDSDKYKHVLYFDANTCGVTPSEFLLYINTTFLSRAGIHPNNTLVKVNGAWLKIGSLPQLLREAGIPLNRQGSRAKDHRPHLKDKEDGTIAVVAATAGQLVKKILEKAPDAGAGAGADAGADAAATDAAATDAGAGAGADAAGADAGAGAAAGLAGRKRTREEDERGKEDERSTSTGDAAPIDSSIVRLFSKAEDEDKPSPAKKARPEGKVEAAEQQSPNLGT